MFTVEFTPTSTFKPIFDKMGLDKKAALCKLLDEFVFEVFFPNAKRYSTEVDDRTGQVKVKVDGIVPFDSKETEQYAQVISNKLLVSKFRELFYISGISTRPMPLDCMLSLTTAKSNMHLKLTEIFNLEDKDIPDSFLCGIDRVIMGNPAYLLTNPKVNYEYATLQRWIQGNQTDPTTRDRISSVGIVKNDVLKQRISSFLIDSVFKRDVGKYFSPTKDVGVGTDPVPASVASIMPSVTAVSVGVEAKGSSVVSLLNNSPLFASPQPNGKIQAEDKARTLHDIFAAFKLDEDFLRLSARGLRRAAFSGETSAIEILFNSVPAAKIIDMKDDNPDSQKTALHVALEKEKIPVVRLLLQNKAAVNIPDAKKRTAREMIEASNNPEIQGLIPVTTLRV